MLLASVLFASFSSVKAVEIERPTEGESYIKRDFGNATVSNDNRTSLGMEVFVDQYYHELPGGLYDHENALTVNVSSIASTRPSIQYSYQNVSYPEPSTYCPWMFENWSRIVSTQEFNSSNIVNGTWVEFNDTFGFRFYGGLYQENVGSSIRTGAWISINGFLSLDLSKFNGSCSSSFPDKAFPNALIAPLWSNLTMDASSKIIVMLVDDWPNSYPTICYYFVVIWKDMLHQPDGKRLTFSVGLREHSPIQESDPSFKGDPILMVYQDVKDINTDFVYGVEDQEGRRSSGGLIAGNSGWLNSTNGCTLNFTQSTNNVILKRLWFTFYDTAADTGNVAYMFLSPAYDVRGRNLLRSGGSSNSLLDYLDSIAGLVGLFEDAKATYNAAVGLLADGFTMSTGVGIVVSCGLLIWDAAGYYGTLTKNYTSQQYNGIQYNIQDSTNYQMPYPFNRTATIYVDTQDNGVVDASLNAKMVFILQPKDNFTISHKIDITAQAVYQEYGPTGWGATTYVSTDVIVGIDPNTNGDFDTATPITRGHYGIDPILYVGPNAVNDYYNITFKESYNVTATLTPSSIQSAFLFLYTPNGDPNRNSTLPDSGTVQTIGSFAPETGGQWSLRVKHNAGFGFYNLTININVIGDINRDDVVNILDAILLANAFTSSWPGGNNWNPSADLNNDGDVDILDAIILANNFNQYYDTSLPAGGMKPQGMMGTLEEASAYLNPSQLNVFKDEIFTINVSLNSVTDLQGWEFKLYWNSTILNCTNATVVTPTIWQGNTQDYGPGLEANYNSTHGRFWKAEAANYPAPSFNGSMTIATLTFQAVQPGTTSLTLTDTILGDSMAQPITCSVSSGSVTVYSGRYMRSDTQTINGLNAYKLNIPESNSSASNTQYGDESPAYWGIRAWVRRSNGTEEEISLGGQTGTPKAVVSRGSGSGIQSATVTVAQTMLQPTDSLVIRVYTKVGTDSTWTLSATFTTEQLQATTLQATTWTIYYYTYAHWNRYTETETAKLYWGTTTYNTRIQNLQYT